MCRDKKESCCFLFFILFEWFLLLRNAFEGYLLNGSFVCGIFATVIVFVVFLYTQGISALFRFLPMLFSPTDGGASVSSLCIEVSAPDYNCSLYKPTFKFHKKKSGFFIYFQIKHSQSKIDFILRAGNCSENLKVFPKRKTRNTNKIKSICITFVKHIPMICMHPLIVLIFFSLRRRRRHAV